MSTSRNGVGLHRILWALAAAAILGGCGGGESGGPAAKGGVGRLADLDSLPVLSLRQDLRVGSVNSADSGFSRIGALTVGPGGLVYVEEKQDREVRVYDSSGRRVRTIGREGDGPGEFRYLGALNFKDDTLWVEDPGAGRITLFSPQGVVLGTIRAPIVRFTVGPELQAAIIGETLREDGLLASSANVRFPYNPGSTLPDSVVLPDLVFDRDGSVVDTIGSIVLPGGGSRSITVAGHPVYVPGVPLPVPLRLATARGLVRIERPFAPRSDDGVIRVTRTDLHGDTVYRTRFRYLPRRFPPGYVDKLAGEGARLPHQLYGTDSAALEKALSGAIALPPFQSPVSLAVVGADGSVWLRREKEGGANWRWDVLDPNGRAVGRFELPRSVSILWARIGELYGAAVDSLGVPWLVRYRVGAS